MPALVGDILEGLSEPLDARSEEMTLAMRAEKEDSLYDRLASRYDRPCNMQKACLDLGIDKCNICSSISKVYGDTPYAFHKRLRILCASVELIAGDRPVGEIANGCGFQKESRFAEGFQKMFGCSPSRFRERYRDLLGGSARIDDRDGGSTGSRG